MNQSATVEFRRLCRLLADLGFTHQTVAGSHETFFHATSSTSIVTRVYGERDVLDTIDLVATRKQLADRGLMTAHDFDRRIAATEVHRDA